MECNICDQKIIKDGRTTKGIQRYRCKTCGARFQKEYSYNACLKDTNSKIVQLLKSSCGIRDISRILRISPTTVIKRILIIADEIRKPPISFGGEYEVDEMITFIGNKNNRVCITYALNRKTREIVGYSIGRRNKTTLRMVVNTLLLSEPKQIRTDKCSLYINLIPNEIHHFKRRGINRIERMNLTLRTHLKRLNRRTIAYSKSLLSLSAILKIYFWS